jgi:hypothetical protein
LKKWVSGQAIVLLTLVGSSKSKPKPSLLNEIKYISPAYIYL